MVKNITIAAKGMKNTTFLLVFSPPKLHNYPSGKIEIDFSQLFRLASIVSHSASEKIVLKTVLGYIACL
jgi:hypothetical protein